MPRCARLTSLKNRLAELERLEAAADAARDSGDLIDANCATLLIQLVLANVRLLDGRASQPWQCGDDTVNAALDLALLQLNTALIDEPDGPRTSRDLVCVLAQYVEDDALPGFYLRVQPSGAKSYAVKYSRRGKSQTVTIGRVNTWNASQARAEAKQLLAAVNRGIDPAADRAARRAALSLHEVAKLWLGFDPMDEKAKPKKAPKRKASTQDGYARALRLHVTEARKPCA